MKKSFLTRVSIIVLALFVLVITGCNNTVNKHDTIKTLETPVVQGKAYPGVNYIYWDKVTNAKNGYRVDIYENDVLIEDLSTTLDADTTFFVDTNLQYGIKKTYKIVCIGDPQARSLYYLESEVASISLNPIVPPLSIKPLELSVFEAGYDKNKTYTLEPDSSTISAENISVVKNFADGTVSLSFNAKPYLKYSIYADSIDENIDYYQKNGNHELTLVKDWYDLSIPVNTKIDFNNAAFSDSDYNVYVQAYSVNSSYAVITEILTECDTTSVNIDLIDSDSDGLKDDAQIIVILPSNKKSLASVKYAKAATNEEATLASETGTALEFTTGTKVYRFVVPNAVTVAEPYFAVTAVITEPEKTDSKAYGVVEYVTDSYPINISSLKIECADNDYVYDDLALKIFALANEEIKVTYAYANTAKNAKLLLDSDKAVEVATLTGYNLYELSGTKYEVLKNVPLNNYVAVKAAYTNKNLTFENSAVLVSSSTTYDDKVSKQTSRPEVILDVLALDSDGKENDVYATIEIQKTQTLTSLIYATSTEEEAEGLGALRLFSEKGIDVLSKITVKYSTDEATIYQVSFKDLPAGTVAAIKAEVSEPNKLNNYNFAISDIISEVKVVLTETAEPLYYPERIYFNCFDNDSKYNDVEFTSDVEIAIYVNQSIKALRYVFAETDSEAADLFRTGSKVPTDITIPEQFYLYSAVYDYTAILVKEYTIDFPTIKNVPLNNYVYFSYVVSEPGYLDKEVIVKTKSRNLLFSTPETIEINVPAYSSVRSIQEPNLTVDDDDNYEYVHLILQDNLVNDSVSLYSYKIERTYEDMYKNEDPIWTTIEASPELKLDDEGYYTFDKWYKDIPVGRYVYRLTKVRKATAEEIVVDKLVDVVYNVEAPSIYINDAEFEHITLQAFEYIDSNFDSLDKYNYLIQYYVVYTDKNGSSTTGETITLKDWSWVNIVDDDEKPTNYYIMDNAVITGINKSNYVSGVVHATLTKTRKIDTDYYDSSYNTLNITWGLTAEIGENFEIEFTSIQDTTVDGAAGKSFTVTFGMDSYKWYLNGVELTEVSNVLFVANQNLKFGSNDLLVVATYNGITYSVSTTVTK